MRPIRIKTSDHAAIAADSLALSTVVIHTHTLRALAKLDEYTPGYPSSASGADRSSGPGDRLDDTNGPTTDEARATELARAEANRRRLVELLERMEADGRELARLVLQYATPGRLKPGEVSDRLRDIWCPNCASHGYMTPRAAGRARCRDCADFLRSEKVERPKRIIDARARGEKITMAMVDAALGRKAS